MNRCSSLFVAIFFIISLSLNGQGVNKKSPIPEKFKKHTISSGLVMAGYQGWFDTPTDGANRGWYHYEFKGRFEPGFCKFDLWPEMSEYEKQYETPFKFDDGTPASLFSPHDESTVRLHFKWMKDYGLDGVFMQRFVCEIKNEPGLNHFNKVLQSAKKAAADYDRTIAVMYDLSGMKPEDVDVLINDWKKLIKMFDLETPGKYANYLTDNGKPVVAVWGVGFDDHRRYGLEEAKKLISFLKSDEGGNCSVLLGIPTYWREQGSDCVKDSTFLDVVKMVDIIHPWFVGRFNEDKYDAFKPLIGNDVEWCNANHKKYMPVVFPGFSWNNMLPKGSPSSTIARNSGKFFWKQLQGATSQGAQLIYVAMFDEIDEGTAIFKTAHRVPVGESKFVQLDADTPSDHYLWLTGKAAKMMKKRAALPIVKPVQK